MKRWFVRFLATLGALYLFGGLLAAFLIFRRSTHKKEIPPKTIVELRFEEPLVDAVPDAFPAALMMEDRFTLRDVVDALDRAASDTRVAGLLVRTDGAKLTFAQTQEIRDAIGRFRAKKKFALAAADTFGEFGPGTTQYYLATACERIWLQPSGDLGLTGIMVESPFLKGTLDKLGLVPRADHRKEYKNALNLFTEKKFTPAHKESMESIAQSILSQLLRGIGEGRNLTEAQVRSLLDKGPFLGKEALDAKLVDQMGYWDDAVAEAKKLSTGGELLRWNRYLDRAGRPNEKGKKTIAVIHALGPIARGHSGFDASDGDPHAGSGTVTAAFRKAAEAKDVQAILFRVNSPGGSYVASDSIWREVSRARAAGKPVIVSMGDVAASGGYFVSMAADKIVVQPATLTGSIGVLGGKLVMSGLWEKLGLSWDEVHIGANAPMWSTNRDYSPAAWARIQAWLDRIYADFTAKVAEGRKLPLQKVEAVAKGRVWTGEQAKAHGLVDELGGFDVALRLAKEAAKIPADEEVKLRTYPRQKGLVEILRDKLRGDEDEDGDAEDMKSVARLPLLERLGEVASALGLERALDAAALEMAPLSVR